MEIVNNPYGYIYITTNLINGKRYIGQKKFNKDWNWYKGSGKALKKAFLKYGRENFHKDIVSIAYSKEELDQLEIEWIDNYNAIKSKDFYNMAEGGLGGNTYKKHPLTKETKKKISEGNLKHKRGKEVICIETGLVYRNIKQTSILTGLHRSCITRVCKGERKTTNNQHFMYYEDYLKQNKK